MKKLLKKMSAMLLTGVLVAGMSFTSLATSTPATEAKKVIGTAAENTAIVNVGVSAADEGKGNAGDTLLAYKVVEITYTAASLNPQYAFSDTFRKFQASELGSEWASLTTEGYGALGSDSEELKTLLGNFAAFVRAAGNEVRDEAASSAVTGNDGIAKFTLPMGQYIIVGDGNSSDAKIYQAVTAEVKPEAEVQDGKTVYVLYEQYNVAMKTSKPSVSKDIIKGTVTDTTLDNNKGEGDKHNKHQQTSDIGKTITYNLKVNVPTYPEGATNKTFYVGDTLSKGLDLLENNGALIVTGYSTETDENGTLLSGGEAFADAVDYVADSKAIVDTENVKTGTALYVDFNFDNIAKYHHVVITYQAKLNADAVLGKTDGNPNDVDLVYSNSPFENTTWEPGKPGEPEDPDNPRPTPGNGYGQDEDKEIVYTYALVIDKFEEKAEGEKLEGAVFEIYRKHDGTGYSEPVMDGENIVTLTTDKNGAALYKGLEAGTYYLKETIAPEDFNLLDGPVVITIDGNSTPYYTETKETVTHYTYTSKQSEANTEYGKEQAKLSGELVWIGEDGEVTTDLTGKDESKFSPAYVKEMSTETHTVTEINKDATGDGANGYYKAGVANSTGAHLPSTGGMGTTLFTIIGLVLMLGAAIALITRRRMASK